VEWDGERKTVPQLLPFLKQPDRAVRERAFRAISAPFIDLRADLAGLFDEMYARRQRIAIEAGLPDFEAYSFRAKCRFDYTPADCTRFHEAVEAAVVPAVGRILERRRQRLGLQRLRPWDRCGSLGPTAIRPSRRRAHAQAPTFSRGRPRVGERFDTMRQERLDLEAGRRGPGGTARRSRSGRPYIHMNAVGLVDDVMTLHEAGHAFHALRPSAAVHLATPRRL
jgi:oligoendopeptidase F